MLMASGNHHHVASPGTPGFRDISVWPKPTDIAGKNIRAAIILPPSKILKTLGVNDRRWFIGDVSVAASMLFDDYKQDLYHGPCCYKLIFPGYVKLYSTNYQPLIMLREPAVIKTSDN